MSALEQFVENDTERIIETLTDGGAPYDLTGTLYVELFLYPRKSNIAKSIGGRSDAVGSRVGIVDIAHQAPGDPTRGQVYFARVLGDLLFSEQPYRIRWQVTHGDGSTGSFTLGELTIWEVLKP